MQEPQDVLNVSVIWRGNKYIVEMNYNASLKELGHELQKLTDVKADTMRLIVPQVSNKGSKLLSPFSDKDSCLSLQEASILEGKSIRMMGVSEDEVDKVQQNAKADLRIAGFDEDEKRMRQRMSYRPHGSLKLPQGPYIFCDFRTLQIPGVELNPPASEALKRMHMLAADPGVVAIMNKHRWRVGIMTEMAPVGYVGVSPKCILGFNKNHGEEISLRLRTDDLKGFRKYESIKKTLLHELAHMVYSEHDANFYALDKQLNQEAASLDWTKSRGHTLSRVRHSEQYEEDFDFGDRENLSQKLGGNMSDQLASARASSVAAAYQRLAHASANSLGASEVNEEPDPDDSGFNIHEEFDAMESVGKENVDIESLNRAQWKPNYEPDPDDGRSGNNKFEPDPDYSHGGETLEPDSEMIKLGAPLKTDAKLAANSCEEPDPDDSSILVEPDPDDCQTMEIMNSGILLKKTINEPDPDDLEEKQNNLGHGNIARPDLGDSIVTEIMEDQTHLNKAHKEPDPDESHANGLMQAEPDPDESYANGFVQAEPDPDESHANGLVQAEPDPDESYANGFVQAEPDPDESHANGLVQAEPDPDDNMMPPLEISSMNIDEPDPDDQEIQRIQDSVTVICGRLQKAIEMLRAEVEPMEATAILQTLFKIISNVIKHPDEMKFKRLRMANPIIQRNIANYKAAMEILVLIGFNEDVVLDGIGKAETYLVLKRNDPGLLWLAKSSLEACIAY